MAFRNLVIENRCKLEYSLNYLICCKGLEETRVLLDEIKVIVINSPQVSITSVLIAECLNRKIKIIFTDSKHNLIGEITPYKNNYYSNRKLKEQLEFNNDNKGFLWKAIIKQKIKNQAANLKFIGCDKEYELLTSYANEVINHDLSNREGHAAKVYFRALFGEYFSRELDNDINKFLNYGYTILLGSFNRAIKIAGYYTEIGIHHIGETNSFNLSCDFIEPLRPLVDLYILKNIVNNENFRDIFIQMLSIEVKYDNKKTFLDNAIEEYIEDLFTYLKTGDDSYIRFIEYDL